MTQQTERVQQEQLIKLDIGCGTRKQQGFIGIDAIAFEGVDMVMDVRTTPWPFEDNSVDEIYTSHFVEHLTGPERISFFNEAHRVLKPKSKLSVVAPSWSHDRAYGDPTHCWPPISSWTFFYLDKNWRDVNAPHVGYTCNFEFQIIGSFDPNDIFVAFRTAEVKMTMMARNINVTTDVIAHLTKREPIIQQPPVEQPNQVPPIETSSDKKKK